MSGIREFHLWTGLGNHSHLCGLAKLTRRVTLQAERVSQFVVVRLVSFVFYFTFIMSLSNHLDPFYQDRFYLGPFLPGPFLPAPEITDQQTTNRNPSPL